MNRKQKQEAELRARFFLILTFARIVAELTIIIGFLVILYLILFWK